MRTFLLVLLAVTILLAMATSYSNLLDGIAEGRRDGNYA